jgi:hypothetical protein
MFSDLQRTVIRAVRPHEAFPQLSVPLLSDRRCNDGGVVCGCVGTRTRGFYFS